MMKNIQILVVEDESIVAMDIQNRLRKLGYTVPVLASSGEEAIRIAGESHPDLVLMDIRLKGATDGIEAANKIQAEFDIPAIYLTAYADEVTLQRAKITAPYGYLLKPFEERELHTTIEMALYKHTMEKKLRESEKWLATILKSISEALIATDDQGRIKFMNPVAASLTGWEQSEAFGKELTEIFNILDEKTRTPSKNAVTKVLQDNMIAGWKTHLLIAKDGTEIPIDDSAAPIRDDTAKIIGVVLTFRDITEERAIQQRIQRQEQLAAIGQLAGGIAHEFNNILTGIIGFAELATSRLDDPLSTRSDLEQIADQGRRAAHLVQQIMDFSRKSIIRKRVLDLVPFLEETVILLRHTIPDNIKLTQVIEPGCEAYALEADPAQIQQALTNIVVNAREAMPAGGVLQFRVSQLSLEPGERPPFPEMESEDRHSNFTKWITLSIADNGAGILPEHRPHIFQPFFTTKEVGQGSGLGLSQVYGIIKQHGGNIDVNSQVGQGTTFTCYLPVKLSAKASSPPKSRLGRIPHGDGQMLLFVEEEPVVMEMAQSMLEYLGYQICTATNSKEALEIFDNRPAEIALVLTDVMVTEVGGISLAQTLARREAAVKVVALTAYPLETEAKTEHPHNIVAYLSKPWSLEQLAQTVWQCLQQE